MGHRLSKIYTRTGDRGETGLGDGSRIGKTSLRVEAMGAVDEVNCFVGLLLTRDVPERLRAALCAIQHDLFDLGGELSIPGARVIEAAQVQGLEAALDDINAGLPPLREFILPGGNEPAALCHIARTVCRRAERRVVALAAAETVNPALVVYLNRLSDLLFVMARALAREHGGSEVCWDRGRKRPSVS
jgi:cob(I)alamin adenosyltransferase